MRDKKNEWIFIYWDDWSGTSQDDTEEKPEEHPQDNKEGTYGSWL